MGCTDTLEGEFIKNEDKLDSKISYIVEEYKGIKVFIPEDLLEFVKSYQEIRIRSNFSFFNIMVLSVGIYDKR